MPKQPQPASTTTILMNADQLRQNIERSKAEHAAIMMVMKEKKRALDLLDDMEGNIAADRLSAALSNFVEIQRIEYKLLIKGFEERLKALESFLKGAESPVLVPSSAIGKLKL